MGESQNSYFADNASARTLFSTGFDRKPFLFSHELHKHELLGFPALQKLAEKISREEKPRGFFRLSGDVLEKDWGSSKFQKALNEAFANIEESKMRMKLSHIHSEPGYGELLARCTRELSNLTSVDLTRDYRDPLATLFITSPGEVTPFHIDSEANFLLQIYGTKTVHIFDASDRELLEWSEIENYWHGDGHIRFRKEMQSRASQFELKPGLGVHNPVHCPHWVQNGPSPSVSLSLGFSRLRSPEDVLHVNYFLRKIGITPTPPGQNPRVDGVKSVIVNHARSIKRVLRPS